MQSIINLFKLTNQENPKARQFNADSLALILPLRLPSLSFELY